MFRKAAAAGYLAPETTVCVCASASRVTIHGLRAPACLRQHERRVKLPGGWGVWPCYQVKITVGPVSCLSSLSNLSGLSPHVTGEHKVRRGSKSRKAAGAKKDRDDTPLSLTKRWGEPVMRRVHGTFDLTAVLLGESDTRCLYVAPVLFGQTRRRRREDSPDAETDSHPGKRQQEGTGRRGAKGSDKHKLADDTVPPSTRLQWGAGYHGLGLSRTQASPEKNTPS